MLSRQVSLLSVGTLPPGLRLAALLVLLFLCSPPSYPFLTIPDFKLLRLQIFWLTDLTSYINNIQNYFLAAVAFCSSAFKNFKVNNILYRIQMSCVFPYIAYFIFYYFPLLFKDLIIFKLFLYDCLYSFSHALHF